MTCCCCCCFLLNDATGSMLCFGEQKEKKRQTDLLHRRHVLRDRHVLGLVRLHVDGRLYETRRADLGDGVKVPLVRHLVVLDADDATNERLELALDEANAPRVAVGGRLRGALPRRRAEQNAANMPAGRRRGASDEAKRHGTVARVAAQRVDALDVIDRATLARQLHLVTNLHATAELVVLNKLAHMSQLAIIRSLTDSTKAHSSGARGEKILSKSNQNSTTEEREKRESEAGHRT